MREYKIVLLGACGVGKSSITCYFIQGVFVETYDPTIEDCYRTDFDYNGQKIMLEIFDTAGTEEFGAMRNFYLRDGNGFILVYSITQMSSIEDTEKIKEDIAMTKESDKCPMILVGNKKDLERDRVISRQMGEDLARKYECDFLEVSAKTGEGIREIFETLVAEMVKRDRKPKSTPARCVLL